MRLDNYLTQRDIEKSITVVIIRATMAVITDSGVNSAVIDDTSMLSLAV